MRKLHPNILLRALRLLNLATCTFRDIREFALTSYLEMFLTSYPNDVPFTLERARFGGILALVPISMVRFSHQAEQPWLQPTTVVAVSLTPGPAKQSTQKGMEEVTHFSVAFFALAQMPWGAFEKLATPKRRARA